jgi:hypothetical protein
MISQERTLEQIRLMGVEALSRDLGSVGMVRFLQQFETDHGDFSTERHERLDQLTVEEALEKIKRHRKASRRSIVAGVVRVVDEYSLLHRS